MLLAHISIPISAAAARSCTALSTSTTPTWSPSLTLREPGRGGGERGYRQLRPPEEYQVARQILGSLNYPLYLIPGNHDDKAHFLSIFTRCARSWATIRKICAMRWMTSPPACCLSIPVMPARQKAG